MKTVTILSTAPRGEPQIDRCPDGACTCSNVTVLLVLSQMPDETDDEFGVRADCIYGDLWWEWRDPFLPQD